MFAIIQPLCQDQKYVQVIHCTSNQGEGLGFIKLSIKRGEAVVSNGLNYYLTGMYLYIISIEYCAQEGAEHSLPIPYICKSATVQRNPCCPLSGEEGVPHVVLCYVLVGPQPCGGILPSQHPTHFLLPCFHSQISLHFDTFIEG